MNKSVFGAALLLCTSVFLPCSVLAAATGDGSRNTTSSVERKQVRTGEELSDRKKRDEEAANAPPPPRVKIPEIPVNPAPGGPVAVPMPAGQ